MAKAQYSRYHIYIKPVLENQVIRSVAPYIFSLVTIAILVVFAIRPTISTVLNLQKNIENNKTVLKALQDKAQNLTLGKENWENLSLEAKTKIEAAVPTKTDVPALIFSLQKSAFLSASTSALQIQPLILIDNTKAEDKALLTLDEIDFSYNLQGSFQKLLATLQNLNKGPRLINMTTAVLSKSAEGPTVLSITGKAYYLK